MKNRIFTAFVALAVLFSTTSCELPQSSESSEIYSQAMPPSAETSSAASQIDTTANEQEPEKEVSIYALENGYGINDIFWLSEQELLICQYSRELPESYRLMLYDVEKASSNLFFEWKSHEAKGEVFQSLAGLKIYADNCMYEIDNNAAVIGESEFASRTGLLSIDGNYVERPHTIGGTYITNGFTGKSLKIFDNTSEVYYHPVSWTFDGEYLVLCKSTYSLDAPIEIVVVDKYGKYIFDIQCAGNANVEWLDGSHNMFVSEQKNQDDLNETSFFIVNLDNGEISEAYTHSYNEFARNVSGKSDSIMLVEAIEKDEGGAATECNIYLYDFVSGEKDFVQKLYYHPNAIAFSPDERYMAVVNGNTGDVHIYECS